MDRFELFTGATSEANLRLYRGLGHVDSGWGPGAAPGRGHVLGKEGLIGFSRPPPRW